MPNEPMTLLDRLRNPAWKSGGTWADAVLHTDQTRDNMKEAASEIERLTKERDAWQQKWMEMGRAALAAGLLSE